LAELGRSAAGPPEVIRLNVRIELETGAAASALGVMLLRARQSLEGELGMTGEELDLGRL
jgi:hypothetical protein